MHRLFDENARKKDAILFIYCDLLEKTRALKINLPATFEKALESQLAEAKAKKWANENKAAIRAYNDFVDENGRFVDENHVISLRSLLHVSTALIIKRSA